MPPDRFPVPRARPAGILAPLPLTTSRDPASARQRPWPTIWRASRCDRYPTERAERRDRM